MKSRLAALATALLMGTGAQDPQSTDAAPRFEAWDVFVDTGEHELGAWQFEWVVNGGGARIVGLEGGEHTAYADAPYYDPAALQGGRILVAAFSTADSLPSGRTRVARVHLMVDAGARPDFTVRLLACSDADGAAIDATIDRRRTD